MTRSSVVKCIVIIIVVAITFVIVLGGCSNKKNDNASKHKIAIAMQYGLAYAPLEIMKQERILEKNMPGIEVMWKQLGNTAAIRESMLSNEVDIGFMAIPPFLVGWDKGMKWKISCGLSSSPVGLVTYKESIKSIKDFSKEDRIAMPQPGSVQDILLSMACEQEFGNPHKLDGLLVTLSHPDGMNALSAKKDITAHFTTPPYLFKELELNGMHQILSGKEAMGGDFTFIVCAATEDFHNNNKEVYKAFIKSVNESINYIYNNPKRSAELLSKVYDMPENEINDYLVSKDTRYSIQVNGINKFAEFMKKNGYITNNINKISDIVWEDVKYED